MWSVEQALSHVLTSVPVAAPESVLLADALGRVSAKTVQSPRAVPPWDNSAMDGYAVVAFDTVDQAEAPDGVRLDLLEVVAAGRAPLELVRAGAASAVMTGAPMPRGADAVVIVENSDGSRSGSVRLRGRATAGQHIRRRGCDIAVGDVVVKGGDTLTPASLGLLASLGLATVDVAVRPRVAVLSTGDEVVLPPAELKPGQIYSSNNITLAAMVRQAGGVALDLGNAPDDREALRARLSEAVEQADVVVTTGGVSAGFFDLVRDAFEDAGATLEFWKIAMKPGKPLAFGHVGDRPMFGLPGNPVSCVVNFLQFVRPWMRTHLGDPRPFLPVVEAVALEDLNVRPGRANLLRVCLEPQPDGRWGCRSAGSQSSAVLTAMARAHGLLLIGASSPGPAAGQACRVQLLDVPFLAGSEPSFGW
jgi:molybdopterin molybdotransferase